MSNRTSTLTRRIRNLFVSAKPATIPQVSGEDMRQQAFRNVIGAANPGKTIAWKADGTYQII